MGTELINMGLKGFQAQALLHKVPKANLRSGPAGRLGGTVKDSSDTPSFLPPWKVWICLLFLQGAYQRHSRFLGPEIPVLESSPPLSSFHLLVDLQGHS